MVADDTKRRQYLKGLGVLGAAGLAGCAGQGSDGDDGDHENDVDRQDDDDGGSSWPPAGGRVEMSSSSATPDDGKQVILFFYQPHLEENLPGDVTVSVSTIPGGTGVVNQNTIYNAEPDGSHIGLVNANTLTLNSVIRENVSEFESNNDFNTIYATETVTRGVYVSHHSQDVSENFEWDWDHFVDVLLDQGDDFIWGSAGVAGTEVPGVLKEEYEPRLSPGDLNIVDYGGGGEARSAIMREEADGVFFSFSGNYPRTDEFYKLQWVWTDERYESHYNMAQDWVADPETGPGSDELRTMHDTPLETEDVEEGVDILMDMRVIITPADVPEETLDILADAWETAGENEELAEDMIESFSRMAHTPSGRETAQQLVSDKEESWKARQDLIGRLYE